MLRLLTLRDRLWAAYIEMADYCEDVAEDIEAELRVEAEGQPGVRPSSDQGRLAFLADRVVALDEEAVRCRAIAAALGKMTT